MIKLKLPIQTLPNVTHVLIGDIYVHCTVSFNPMVPPSNKEEEMLIRDLNSQLNFLGHQIAAEMSHKVEDFLKKQE